MLGVHQKGGGGDKEDDHNERKAEGRLQRYAGNALRAVERKGASADIDVELQVVENQTDRLADAEGGDAEIVALEVQGDLAKRRAERHGNEPGDDQRHPIGQTERHRADNGDISADAHKARVTEGEHTGVAGQDGKAQHDEHRVAGLDQNTFNIIPTKHILSSLLTPCLR